MTVSRSQIRATILCAGALLGLCLLLLLRLDYTLRPVETSTTLEPESAHVGLDMEPPASPGRTAADAPSAAAAVQAGESKTPDLVSSSGTRLHGFVLPVQGTREEVLARVELIDGAGEQWSAVSGPLSGYEFLELPPGPYSITARSGANEHVRRTLELKEGEREHQLDLRLEAMQEVAVQVVNASGEPIPQGSMVVIATVDRPGEWIDVSDRKSMADVARWKETSPGVGRLQLPVPPPIHVSVVRGEYVVATQRVEPFQESARFVLDAADPLLQDARVRLRLVDARTGEPIALAVTIFEGERAFDLTAGSDGELEFDAPPGRLLIEPARPDWQSPIIEWRTAPGANNLGDVKVEPAVHVSGWILDENGPVVSASVWWESGEAPSERPTNLWSGRRTFSEPDGSFRIDGLSQGRHRLSISADGRALQVLEVDTSIGSVENVTVKLSRGIVLKISGSSQRANRRCSLWDERGLRLCTMIVRGPESQEILVAPGRYELELRIGSGEPQRRPILVGSEPLEIALP